MGLKRFAVPLCAEDSEYVKRQYGGYYRVYKGLLAKEGEVWDVYCVAAGELPDDGEIGLYDGLVITGGCSNAHGDDTWICQLINLLKKLDFTKKKVLGVCFGHQLKELPTKAEVIARSDKMGIEMFRYGDHILGIQGHPEYTCDILLDLVDRLLLRSLITYSCADELKVNMGACEPDRKAWKRLCIYFLKGRCVKMGHKAWKRLCTSFLKGRRAIMGHEPIS